MVGSIPTVARHIFQACPVRIYTQSNITSIFNCKFSSLDTNNLFLYCVSMNNKNIINSTAKYIYEIMNTFWDLACI